MFITLLLQRLVKSRWIVVHKRLWATYFPLSHLMVGGGSPTALHGNTMSFIQGVVTVPLNVRILAGAATHTDKQNKHIKKAMSSQIPLANKKELNFINKHKTFHSVVHIVCNCEL